MSYPKNNFRQAFGMSNYQHLRNQKARDYIFFLSNQNKRAQSNKKPINYNNVNQLSPCSTQISPQISSLRYKNLKQEISRAGGDSDVKNPHIPLIKNQGPISNAVKCPATYLFDKKKPVSQNSKNNAINTEQDRYEALSITVRDPDTNELKQIPLKRNGDNKYSFKLPS